MVTRLMVQDINAYCRKTKAISMAMDEHGTPYDKARKHMLDCW